MDVHYLHHERCTWEGRAFPKNVLEYWSLENNEEHYVTCMWHFFIIRHSAWLFHAFRC